MSWEDSVEKFLKKYKSHEHFIGALVSGSFVTGTQTEKSDIDLHIVMSDKFHQRKKGLLRMNGFLISYLVYPVRLFNQILEINFLRHQRIIARFYAKGTILHDTDNVLATLKERSLKHLKGPLDPVSHDKQENVKYVLFTVWEDLADLYEKEDSGPYYNLLYYRLLDLLFYSYSMFLRTDCVNTIRSLSKLRQFFTDPNWNKNYHLPAEYPDKIFATLFIDCLDKIDHDNIEELVFYVIDKMDGFDPDDWHMTAPILD